VPDAKYGEAQWCPHGKVVPATICDECAKEVGAMPMQIDREWLKRKIVESGTEPDPPCEAGVDRTSPTDADADEVEKLAREARAAYDETWPKGDSWLNVARFILTRERELLMQGLVAPDAPSTAYEDIVRWLENRLATLTTLLNERKP
jgi:hypothetical protein